MRTFVVLGHTATTDPDFSLDDLAGGAGRLDVLCRCVNAAFFLSHAIREDVRVYLVFGGEVTLRLEGSGLRYLNPDERNIASLLRRGLAAAEDAVGHREVESTPGIHASTRGFEPVLEAAGRDRTVVHLHEEGDPIVDLDPPTDPVFVLSDHRDFTDGEAALLEDAADATVCLSPERLHADHAITVAHNYLDTGGYTLYSDS